MIGLYKSDKLKGIQKVLLLVLCLLSIKGKAQTTKYEVFRTGTFQYEDLGNSCEVIRTTDTQTEIYNNGESKLILDIKWLNDSTYILTRRESINAPGCLKKYDSIKTTITAVDRDRYTCKYTSSSCGDGQSVMIKIDSSYNLLWKIENKNTTNTGYLFGTIHVFDERAFNFSDSVMLGIEACDVFALEVHPDSMIKKTLELMMNKDTTNYFKKSMSDEEYQIFKQKFSAENSIDFEELENKHPLNINAFNNQYEGNKDRKTFIDLHLFGIARTLGKKTIGLEPIDNQVNGIMLNSIQKARFGTNDDSVSHRKLMEELIKSYSKGNLKSIENTIGSSLAESQMMVKRNQDMVETIMNTLESNSLFSAVGAGHLIGNKSMITMLRANGYDVTKVKSTFTGVAEKYEINETLMPWHIFVDVEGGYQTTFPKDNSLIKRTVPTETEFGPDTIAININMHTDISSMRNYTIAYNDFPIGYYLESKEEMFDLLKKEFTESGIVIESTKDVEHNGYEGKLFKLLIKEQFKAVLHVFVRGNRLYKFMNQNLDSGKKVENENILIENLKFLPYGSSEIKQKKYNELSLPYFEKNRIVIDSTIERLAYFKEGIVWYSDDPTTGNAMNISIYKVKDLLSIQNLDTFYEEYSEALTTWNDMIILSKTVFKDGNQGYEVLVTTAEKQAYTRFQMWFYDDVATIYSIYSDSTGVYCDNAESFLKAQMFKNPKSQKNLLRNKTPLVLSNLYSTDSLTASTSVDALNYNTIDSTYALQLEASLLAGYMNDTLHNEQSEALIDLLFSIPSYDPKKLCYQIAKNLEAPDYLRSCAISKLYELGDTIPALDLLFKYVPKSSNYYCNVFSPFNSSMELVDTYFEQLLECLRLDEHQGKILNFISEYAGSSNTGYTTKVQENYENITRNFIYKVDTTNNVTSYDLIKYINFLSSFSNEKNKTLIEQIDTSNLSLYVQSSLAYARVMHDMKVDTIMKNKLLSSQYLKFDLQKILLQKGRISDLPDSLQTEKSLYRSSLEYYTLDNDCYECKIELLGTIRDSTKAKYQVYKIVEEYEGDSLCQIGIVNMTRKQGSLKYEDVKSYSTYLENCDFKEWKQLAKDKLNNFYNYAY